MTELLTLKDDLEIESSDIQTGHLQVSKEYDRDDRGNRSEFKGYRIHRRVTIFQRDLQRFDAFLSKILASGDREVAMNYESSRYHEIRMTTRLEAVRIAREKAEQMAEVLGVSLGKVLVVEEFLPEGRSSSWGPMSNSAVSHVTPQAVDDLAAGSFAPDAVEVKVTIHATFEIE